MSEGHWQAKVTASIIRTTIVSVVVIAMSVCTAIAEDQGQLSLRLSGGHQWNFGWDMKFYFHTGNVEDYLNDPEGEMDKWYRTLHHWSGPNMALRWTQPISREYSMIFTARYQNIEFGLRDSLVNIISFLRHYKSLNAELHFVSVATGIAAKTSVVTPYVELAGGYCFASLRTSQIFEVADEGTSAVDVDGNGGGLYLQGFLGVSKRLHPNVDFFAELSYLISDQWEPIPADDVQASLNNSLPGEQPQISYEWLITLDRELARFYGVGIEFGIVFSLP